MLSGKNQVESRVVRMFWNDGLLDVLVGCGILLMGVAWLAGLIPLGAVVPALLLPFWKPLRARFTEPRLGYVEFSDVQQQRNRSFLIAAIGLGVVVLLGALTAYAAATEGFTLWPWSNVAALPGCIMGSLLLATAAATSQRRFVAYAAALGLCGAVVAALDTEPGWALLIGGALVLIGGAITVSQFKARYPLPGAAT